MLIPLVQHHESESSEVVPVDLCFVDGNISDNDNPPSCTGPVIHSQTKLQGLLKANVLMKECDETSVNFALMEPCSYTLKTLIADYFQLQKEFLDQVLGN